MTCISWLGVRPHPGRPVNYSNLNQRHGYSFPRDLDLCSNALFHLILLSCSFIFRFMFSHLFLFSCSPIFRFMFFHLILLSCSPTFRFMFSHLVLLSCSHIFRFMFSHVILLSCSFIIRFMFLVLDPAALLLV